MDAAARTSPDSALARLRRAFPGGRALPDEQWAEHHGFVLRTLVALCVAVAGYALVQGHPPLHAAAHAAPLVLLTLAARATALPRVHRAGAGAAALMTAAALVVHLSGGQTEAHFLFFALLPLATLYATPVPFVLAVAYVAVHHFLFGTLFPGSVFAHDVPALGMAAVHAAFVVLESWACVVAWRRFEDRRTRVESLVTSRTAELRAQRDELARLAAVVQSTDDAVATLSPDGRILTWNPGAERLYGWSAAEAVGRPIGVVVPEGQPRSTRAVLEEVAENFGLSVERTHRRRDGRCFDALVTLSAIRDDEGRTTGIAAISRDISGQKRSQAEALAAAHRLQEQADELARLALHDPLTGLANRALMRDRLEHALAARRVPRRDAVLLLDLDDFKSVNDVFGHGAGDAVLTEVARRLQACVRPDDTVARLGGDEFVVLMEDVDGRADACAVAERLLAAIVRPVPWGTERFEVGCSIGITLTGTRDRRGPDELLRDADIAMYAAKSAGRNRARVFEPGMRDDVVAHDRLVGDLREAIPGGQLRLLFQPQVDLRSGCVDGVEGLVRWEHPERGLLAPGDFLPVAESAGLVDAIDDWVLETACAQLRDWREADLPPLRVSINVSARRLARGDLPAAVAARSDEAGVDVGRLELEVTETLATGSDTDAAEALDGVRRLGASVAIDDFGMGHSSFSRLQAFPLDRLKIDRSFVAPLRAGAAEGSIAGAMVALGAGLGLGVVAEGVETREQLAALQELGCRSAQGFLFSPPVPADEVARLVRAGAPLLPR
ncbi:putative bifunctional diguanylate cyclase/phosphodiesterase [Geodermatophilus sp. SYSU D00815]